MYPLGPVITANHTQLAIVVTKVLPFCLGHPRLVRDVMLVDTVISPDPSVTSHAIHDKKIAVYVYCK